MRTTIFSILVLMDFACNQPQTKVFQIEWLSLPTSGNNGLPYLEKGLDGVLRCSWVETSGDTATLKFSEFRNEQWATPEFVASGTDWFVNWADYPKISASGNMMIAHFLQKSSTDTYAYDVKVKIRNQSGWGKPFNVHSDTTQTEHGFVSMVPMEGDQFRLVWLDGRNTTGAHAGAMTLRTAIIDQQGNISDRTLLDERVCDCCATAVTFTGDGPIAAYRDRSDKDENGNEIRDIYLTKFEEDQWTNPVPANNDFWEISGCPVNGPSIDAKENLVSLGWFTGAQNKPRVQLAISKDGGQSFSAPVTIDDKAPHGRVVTKILDEQRVAVVWLARNGEDAQIKLKIINEMGTVLKKTVITETSGARASGFPQIAVSEGYIYFANTQVGENLQIQVGRMRY